MIMRVGGLATGMEIDSIVERLMEAERMPLDRLKQDQTTLEWKQDAYRKINRSLLELDQMLFDMKLSPTYRSKTIQSSNEKSVTATASTSATNGSYQLKVLQLASQAMNIGKPKEELDLSKSLQELEILEEDSTIHFKTYDELGNGTEYEVEIQADDTLENVFQKVNDKVDHLQFFYDQNSNQVVLETLHTGNNNENGVEIEFNEEHSLFEYLGLKMNQERGGNNAKFVYNNELVLESKTNDYSMNGVHFEFFQTTEENVRIAVSDDIDHTVDSIKNLVEQYNKVIDLLNESQLEERYRDFPPLTEEQKEEMTERQIEQWEEKAKSGLLRGDYTVMQGLTNMRQSWTMAINEEGSIRVIQQMGLHPTNRYMDGGKIELNETELREAIMQHPEEVEQFFRKSDSDSPGIIDRLENSVKQMIGRIEETAGRASQTRESYTLGRQMNDLNQRISQFEERLIRTETRYWNQFTEMEKAIQRMNDQSNLLFSQFNDL